eukprot:2783134-Rhodomonas_salina.3
MSADLARAVGGVGVVHAEHHVVSQRVLDLQLRCLPLPELRADLGDRDRVRLANHALALSLRRRKRPQVARRRVPSVPNACVKVSESGLHHPFPAVSGPDPALGVLSPGHRLLHVCDSRRVATSSASSSNAYQNSPLHRPQLAPRQVSAPDQFRKRQRLTCRR